MASIWVSIHRILDKFSLPGHGKNIIQRYGLVIILIVIFYLIKVILISALGKDVPFLFSLFIVIISAWFGGLGPGILATILSGGFTYYLYLEPKYTIYEEGDLSNIFILITFFIEGIFISMMSEAHRRNDSQRSEFIGVLSHELKNPLTSVKGYAAMIQRLAKRGGQQKIADYSARIDQQVGQVVHMINEMMDITKIETGRLTYQDEEFDLALLVKERVSDQQVTTSTHKIYYTINGNAICKGDRYRIGQVITNLISNAIKYSPKEKKILVKVTSSKNWHTVSIQDFGLGIAKGDRERLFDPFFRAKNAKDAKGSGIGLYISSQIIRRHNGKIWVKSTPGKGSVFYFTLPRL